jgi:ketosteroid isomerase-like protein
MTETEDFLKAVLPRLTEVEIAFHNGDVSPRFAIWSHNDPVTLFGAALSGTGWGELGPAFEWLASGFSNCESYEIELIAAGASGDLAYMVAIEHTTASIRGAAPKAYQLRATTVFRRENGEWKAVHRHGDPAPEGEAAARAQIARFGEGPPK